MFHVKQFIGIKKRGAEDIAPYNDTRMDICRGRRPRRPVSISACSGSIFCVLSLYNIFPDIFYHNTISLRLYTDCDILQVSPVFTIQCPWNRFL